MPFGFGGRSTHLDWYRAGAPLLLAIWDCELEGASWYVPRTSKIRFATRELVRLAHPHSLAPWRDPTGGVVLKKKQKKPRSGGSGVSGADRGADTIHAQSDWSSLPISYATEAR